MITAKIVTSNRFPRADEQAQSIEKLFGLNVKESSKIQDFGNILNIIK